MKKETREPAAGKATDPALAPAAQVHPAPTGAAPRVTSPGAGIPAPPAVGGARTLAEMEELARRHAAGKKGSDRR
ncbi:MAG: hypothetical protein HY521_13070 [Proteobacteria bacterium]|nr:hypothetical protein [Pseudomonadota bacterium]